jgi:thiol-disulfide isomerase/thioredoxin
MAKFAVRSAIVFCALYSFAQAESKLTLPGCDVTPALRTELTQKLDYKKLEGMPYAERVKYRLGVLNDLATRYPREFAPEQRLIQDTANEEPDQLPELRRRFREVAAQRPDDPLAQTILARSLISQDTPAAIGLLDQLRNIPHFPAPSLILAGVYADGKRLDKRKATEYLSDYIKQCPATTDQDAQWLLGKLGTPEMQTKVATALRERLAQETDPEVLRSYETLWGLEFRVHPPQEHDALRKQVARDLRRLATANPKHDSAWAGMLLSGLKQSGASPAEVAAAEDNLSHDYPASSEASRIASDRWQKQHKEPENQKDLEAWKTYSAQYRKQQLLWRSTFTEVDDLRPSTFYAAMSDPGLTESEAVKLMEDYLQWGETYKVPASGTYDTAASVLLDHHWQSARALELMQKAMIQDQLEQARQARDDNRAETGLWSESELREHLSILEDFLRAALAANRPDVVSPYRAEIEAKPAGDVLGAEYRWRANQARLAVLDGHKADALAFYQQALRTRPSPVEYWHGRLDDPLTEDAHSLWTGMGGSEVAWTLWSAAPPNDTKLAQGAWRTPAKSLPAFELADLAGKTWRLKNLEGKTVLVNVWATWCGPCQAELPKLEQLYKQTKDRPDVQILTFNIDSDLGLVQPFVREKGFTFPVLPAYALVNSVVDDIAIPQNWILDSKGIWRLTQLGYGAEEDWGGAMLKKMETVR